MFNPLTLLSRKREPAFVMKPTRDAERYEREKTRAQTGLVDQRMELARSPRTHQEILYYMAEHDTDPAIRQAVARNLATPIHASAILTKDQSEDVRLALLERLVHLLPELSKEDYSQLYAVAVQALSALAKDEVLKIRMALSSALKDHAYAPPAVVAELARDVERQVSEPILRLCTALADDVILDILKGTKESWIVEAVAGRKAVSDAVSAAVIGHGDPTGGRALIANPGAVLTADVLQQIVQRARELPEWQEPLALRKGLPPEISQALAEYAQDSVRKILERKGGFGARMSEEVARIFKRRLNYAVRSDVDQKKLHEKPYDRAVRLAKAGQLDERTVSDALGMREEAFVIAAIACLAKTDPATVKRIFGLHAAKPIVALSWKAGFSMRMALELQKTLGRVHPKDLLYPRGGTDYPLTREEIDWQLEFFGLRAA